MLVKSWRMQLAAGLLGVVTVLGGRVSADPGDVFYVNQNNTSPVQNGLSWATALTTLQEGIETARRNFGGEVWVAAGVYDEARENEGTLQLRSGVEVFGGFSGNENARNQRDWETHLTIIDGSVATEGAPAAHVLTGANNSRLDGFIIRGGRGAFGAGMINAETAPIVANCVFTDNEAASFGGALINVDNANGQFLNCRFEGNSALDSGGAVANSNASPLFRDCVFLENTAAGSGGALFNTPGSSPVLEGCEFRLNVAVNGGAIFSDQADPFIERCYFFDNEAERFGGAIFNSGLAEGIIVNSVFARNAAQTEQGGAIANQESGLFLLNCTITDNAAGVNGGGIFSNGRQLLVINSIIWANKPRQFSMIGADLRVNYSNIDGQMRGDGNINFPPRFQDAANDNFNLKPFSRSINAGTATPAPDDDILGTPRPQGAGVDMGAYEATEIGTPEPIPPVGCLFLGRLDGGGHGSGPGDAAVYSLAGLLLLLFAAARRRRVLRTA